MKTQDRNVYKPLFLIIIMRKINTKQRKEELKKILNKEWKTTNQFSEYKGKHAIAYKLLQELVDEGFAIKMKINNITYWKKKR